MIVLPGLDSIGAEQWVSAAPVPDPEQPLREGLTESDISPGVLGFLSIFVVAVASVVLVRSLVSKLRGVQYRAAHEEALAEDAERDRAAGGEPSGRTDDGHVDPDGTAEDDTGDGPRTIG